MLKEKLPSQIKISAALSRSGLECLTDTDDMGAKIGLLKVKLL